jgi:hypothetical protein
MSKRNRRKVWHLFGPVVTESENGSKAPKHCRAVSVTLLGSGLGTVISDHCGAQAVWLMHERVAARLAVSATVLCPRSPVGLRW